MAEGLDALTEKEKDTLRLIVRGHDAKSTAGELSLSVHTINERLRAARRKLSVTSSREAARLLLEHEGEDHKSLADKPFGDASPRELAEQSDPLNDRHRDGRGPWRAIALVIGGLIMLTTMLAMLLAPTGVGDNVLTGAPDETRPVVAALADAAPEQSARDWLALTDASDWRRSYEATGNTFRQLNTLALWQETSQQARAPLGDALARDAISFQNVNAPPHGYAIVSFRTVFENKAGVIETVTLEREGGAFRVVGYTID